MRMLIEVKCAIIVVVCYSVNDIFIANITGSDNGTDKGYGTGMPKMVLTKKNFSYRTLYL